MEETTARGFAELREALASRTGPRPEDWFPVFKARYGMQVAFDAVRSVRGDGSVLTQLFTCCTAVDPIVVSGLRPRYADVGADTMGIDVAKVESMPLGSDEQVHAMVMQHTFGAIDEDSSRRLAALAGEMGALLVEDCAHCVTRMARDAAGWPLADISVHSFGVEKMLPTRFGGAIWVNPRLRERDAALDAETRGPLDANETGRRAVVTMYREAFAGVDGLDVPAVAMDGEAQPLLRFPLFARDTEAAERIIAAARQAGGYAERWYRPELFPGGTDPAAYGLDTLDRSTVPVSDRLVSTALCLPTELGEDAVRRVIDAVRAAV